MEDKDVTATVGHRRKAEIAGGNLVALRRGIGRSLVVTGLVSFNLTPLHMLCVSLGREEDISVNDLFLLAVV